MYPCYGFWLCYSSVVKRLPEHIQVDDPAVVRKLAKKLERQQVSKFSYMRYIWVIPPSPPLSLFTSSATDHVDTASHLLQMLYLPFLTEVRARDPHKCVSSQGLAPYCVCSGTFFSFFSFFYYFFFCFLNVYFVSAHE